MTVALLGELKNNHYEFQNIMKFASLHDLYIEQLKDLHSAESQLTKALPKMAKAANSPELKSAFTDHLAETKEQLARLNQIGEKLKKSLTGHTVPR
jgi:ferritin-like metal-binding protein YciE